MHVAGAAPDSPLVARLREAIGPGATVSAGCPVVGERRWQALLLGCGLGCGGPEDGATAPGPDAVLLDLHGRVAACGKRVWRVVDAGGRPVFRPFFAEDGCCRPAGFVSLFLVESRDGGAGWVQLGEAHPGAWQPYRKLLRAIGVAVVALVASALRSPPKPTPWRPVPAIVRRRRGARLRRHAAYALRRLRDKVTADVWAIGVLDGPPERLLGGGVVAADRWIALPEGEGFLADPFPWPGRPGIVLCERFDGRTGLGRLQALPIGVPGPCRGEDLPIGVDGHLSYPFAWADGGRVYCLPEMAACRRQALYELRPGEPPRAVATIAEGIGMADPTLFRHGGLYWIAYTDVDLGLHDNLCLLWAERLEGPWTKHRRNPVKVDVRSARCAGGLIRLRGDLIRPAQDCARGYGTAIVLNRVLDCTPEEYREEPVAVLSPDPAGPYPDGLHTLSVADRSLVVDGKRVVVDPWLVWRRVLARVRRLV